MTHDELHPANHLATIAPRILAALNTPAGRISALRILRHKPGRRALIAYTLETPQTPPQTILGKLRVKSVDKHGYTIQCALWQQGFTLPNLSVPEPLAILPAERLWLQRQVPGRPATELLNPHSPPALWADIGRAIAALHHSHIPTTRRWNIEDELTLLHDRLHKAAAIHPELAARIHALIAPTTALAETLHHRPICGIHRDCYPDQNLVDGTHLYWLDLDLYSEGDPALDVGNYLAHIQEHALRHHGDLAACTTQERALHDAYLSANPTAADPAAIAAWTTLSLARHIYLSTQFPDRHHTTATLLAACESRLQAQ